MKFLSGIHAAIQRLLVRAKIRNAEPERRSPHQKRSRRRERLSLAPKRRRGGHRRSYLPNYNRPRCMFRHARMTRAQSLKRWLSIHAMDAVTNKIDAARNARFVSHAIADRVAELRKAV